MRLMDVEKTMEFIHSQQAQFASQQAQLAAGLQEIRGVCMTLVETQSRQQGLIDQLIAAVGGLAETTSQGFQRVADFQRQTELRFQELTDKLDVLIKVVNGLIHRNGQEP